jgi:hypothetical protein
MKLYRAADTDILTGPTSFAADLDCARAYLDNPGFGGSTLYQVDVEPESVLDLTDESDQLDALVELTGIDMGSTTADHMLAHEHVVASLVELGYTWVRLTDTYPDDCETWTWLYSGDEPEMEEM